jgi:hypothetical protein
MIFFHLAYPTKTLAKALVKSAPWRLQGKPRTIRRTRIKRYKIPVRDHQAKNKTSGATIRTYLFPALFAAYKVGCRVEIFLQSFSGPPTWDHSHLAFQSEATLQSASPLVRFDSDSYPIGVNSHASRCMANKAHLFEDLRLNKDKGQVDGISDGLEIASKDTFKFNIKDNGGRQHTIRITNSLYVPDMRRCLLLPQHWAQEAGDEQTWMEFKRQWPYDCVLHWNRGKKTIPHQPSTNVPVFYTASSSTRYRAFAATFEVMEASFFQREKVLQFPGCRDLLDNIDPAEFVAEENLNYKEKEMSEDEGVNEDNETIKTSNVPPLTASEDPPSEAFGRGPLTFNPHPQEKEDEQTTLAASDQQAELMCWHYRLGHLPVSRLKQLTTNSKIPKKLAKVAPPKCAGRLFGAMTKIPWRGKETKASHEVCVATKPGECVSVDQMTSPELGFVTQLKDKLLPSSLTATVDFGMSTPR